MPWQGGQKISDKNYLKIFILGQKLLKIFVLPRTNFIWVGQNFQKIIVLGQNFSENFCPRTKTFIP